MRPGRPRGRPGPEEEVEEELAFHREMRIREELARGLSRAEAEARVRRRMGDVEEVRRVCTRLAREREARMRWRRWWDEARGDLAFALRQLRRAPGFALAAVLTLGLGMGANTAVFSVVEGVLLRPLPYEEPEELVGLWTRFLPSSGVDIPRFPLSWPEVLDYRGEADALESVGAYRVGRTTLTGEGGDPDRTPTVFVDREVLPLLGAEPVLGRSLAPEEHEPGAAPVLLLSHGLWTQRYGADPDIVGRSVTVDGARARVVGVMPHDFTFPRAGVRLWMPLGLDPADPGSRGAHWLLAVGRLADGATLAEARAELEGITAGWNETWEHHAAGHFIFLVPLRDDLVGEARPVLLFLLAAVGLILLAACVNVANLFVARSESRGDEMAVRRALGAGRGRLLRQLLAEGFVVASLGAVVGVALAAWITPVLLAVDPAALPRTEAVGIRAPVLAFTGAVVVATTLVLGLLPGWRLPGRRDGGGAGSLRSRRGLGGGRARLRRGLVAVEVGLSLVVVVGAGLLVRSLRSLQSVETGIEAAPVLTAELNLPSGSYPEADEVARTYERLLDRIAGLPGVASASAASTLPLAGPGVRADFRPEGAPEPRPGVPDRNAEVVVVHPDYFRTLGIPLSRGRPLDRRDRAGSTPAVVVNEAFVRTWGSDEEVVGRRLTFDVGSDEPTWLTVVGVVGDTRSEMEEPPGPTVYLAHGQLAAAGWGTGRGLTLVVRGAGAGTGALAGPVREVVREIDPDLPVEVGSLEEVRREATARSRLAVRVVGGFALLALLLAAVGIYGVVSFAVRRRTREIGLRMALGAHRRAVAGLVLREGLAPALVGVAGGVGVALLASGLVGNLLYEIRPTDPLTFVTVPLLLLVVAVLASWVPARRATHMGPAEALREG